ncbi:hypothetical protein WMF27_37770 [Sorangium sp. So ce281]|uniref:hypothetical protein n=1 Tax=unclassified Sorangium TaxID=2621164 RepID=UPI003F5E82DF
MSAAAWQESVNPVLLERLLRPLVAPGVISLALVRRILRGVERFSARLPLLAHLARRRGQAGGLRVDEVPIVHGRWVAPPRPEPSAPALAPAATREVIVVKAAPPARPGEGAGLRGAPAAPAAAGAALVHVTVPAAAATSAGALQGGEERAARDASAAPAAPAAPRAAFDSDRAPSPVAGGPTATLPVVTSAPLPVALATHSAGASLPLVLAAAPRAAAQRAAAPRPAAPRAASAAVAPSSRPVVAPRSPARSPAPSEARAQLPHAPLSRGAQVPLRPARGVDDDTPVALRDGPRRPVVQPSPAQRGAAAAAAAPGPLPHGAPPLPRVAPAPEPAAPRPDHLPHVRVAGGRAEAQAAAAPDSAAPVAAPGAPVLPPRAMPVAAATQVVPGSVSPLAAAPGPAAGTLGMDLETLVDKVQRKLVRRMSAERERRGGFR